MSDTFRGGLKVGNVRNPVITQILTPAPASGVVRGGATLDFPSIAAAGTQTLTVTVTGAAVGDQVLLSLPATVNAGVVFDARVTAADTVTVRAQNITASAIDPASAVYTLTVLKLR